MKYLPYLLFLKKQQNLTLSSAAGNCRWSFMGYDVHTQLSNEARGLKFGLSLHVDVCSLYYVCYK